MTQRLPDLDGWATIATIAELGSFTAAAETLGRSKATVSKAVARLEAALGQALFNRTSRRVVPTAAARPLIDHAHAMLAAARAAEEAARDGGGGMRGPIHLAAPLGFGEMNVAAPIAAFMAAHPDVALSLDLSDARVDLIAGGYDLAIRIGRLPDSSLRARRLGAVASHIVAAPAYLAAQGRPETAEALREHRLFGYANRPGPWRLRNGDEEVLVDPRGPLIVNSGAAMLPALLGGLGIAWLPGFIVGPHIATGALVDLLPAWSATDDGLYLVTPPSPLRPARVEALIAFLAERLRNPCATAAGGGARDLPPLSPMIDSMSRR